MNTQTFSFAHIRRINEICDCPCGCRESIADELLNADYSKLPAFLQVEYYYVLLKFYNHRANSNFKTRLQNLELSNDYANKLLMTVEQGNVRITKPQKLFKASHVKFLLSNEVSQAEDKEMLQQRALEIATKAIKQFPENKSVIWLIGEINSNNSKS